MTKKDLRPGMIVQYRDGEYALVMSIDNNMVILGRDSNIPISALKEDLTCFSNDNSTVDKVFTINKYYPFQTLTDILKGKYLSLIWKRSKQVEYTIEELESKLGLKSGTLRIKK